ncbi:MAG: hypothetical protein V1791_03070 [Pseudomonadota bacterium]
MTARAKSHKDLYQTYQLLSFFNRERPFELKESWRNLINRGEAWKKRAEAGLKVMEKEFGKIEVA